MLAASFFYLMTGGCFSSAAVHFRVNDVFTMLGLTSSTVPVAWESIAPGASFTDYWDQHRADASSWLNWGQSRTSH